MVAPAISQMTILMQPAILMRRTILLQLATLVHRMSALNDGSRKWQWLLQTAILIGTTILLQLVTLAHRMTILILGIMAPANSNSCVKNDSSATSNLVHNAE